MQRTGIRERHIVDPGVATSDLATMAAREAIERAGPHAGRYRRDHRRHGDARTCCSRAPRASCKHKIGAKNAWGFDLSAACSRLHLCADGRQHSIVASGGAKHALVIGADVMSSIIDYTDRATCVLFGDGAGAVVLGVSNDENVRHPRLRAHDRRQRRSGAVHARGRQQAAGVAQDRRRAPALREAGRADGVQVRGAQHRRDLRAPAEAAPISPARISRCSCRTRRTSESSCRRPSASACLMRKSIINIDMYGNTTAATIPARAQHRRRDRQAEEGRSDPADVGRRRLHRWFGPGSVGHLSGQLSSTVSNLHVEGCPGGQVTPSK